MKLEDQLQQLPKPVLAGLVISIVIVLLFVLNPPHTLCDAQTANLQTNLAGVLFPIKVGKTTMTGKIHKTMEVCLFGNTGGSCYEYFDILRRAAKSIKEAPAECASSMLAVRISKYAKTEEYQEVRDGKKTREELSGVSYKEVSLEQVFMDGLEIMIQKAWGEAPPEPGPQRFGWFKESEMNVFCHVRDVLIRGKTREALMTSVKKFYAKLPGEAVPPEVTDARMRASLPRRANKVFKEQEIFERSLMSAPCDYFR